MTRRDALTTLALTFAGLTVLPGCDAVKGIIGPKATPTPAPTPVPVATPEVPSGPPPFDKTVFAEMTGRSQDTRIPVIMFHDIVPERTKSSVYFDCSRDEFTEIMDKIATAGMSPISLETLHQHLTRGEILPSQPIVLTFDDNYQGFFDVAYPILKEKNYPGSMFVHTNFVGDKKGAHPKMDWDTLRILDKDGLVTIGSHTLSHPDDMAKLSLSDQETELRDSKAKLEEELGHPIPYFAYPNGKGDKTTYQAAKDAGYTMAFTIENGPVEESPGILILNRYIHTRFDKAVKECQDAFDNVPANVFEKTWSEAPVKLEVQEFDDIKMGVVRGGKPMTVRADDGVRKSVGEFVQEAGGVAGMNGTFFANAALRGTDNQMIGPSKTSLETEFFPEVAEYRLPKLRNRPLVIIGPTKVMIVPFQAGFMNDEFAVQDLLPDYTDVFLAGGWIVHNGEARTADQLRPYAVADFNDPRRRAAFGVTETGEPVLIGSLEVITTERFAKAVAAAGVQEAVLLDSGFSTSIVFDSKIIVTGHTATNLPSRPVPQAIILNGMVEPPTDPDVLEFLDKASPAVGDISAAEAQAAAPGPTTTRRRRRKK